MSTHPKHTLSVGRYAKTKADVLIAIGSLSVHTKRGWDQTEYPEGERLSFWFEDQGKSCRLSTSVVTEHGCMLSKGISRDGV